MTSHDTSHDTIDVVDPLGSDRAAAEVLEARGDLVVVDDPFTPGFSVVVAGLGIGLTGHRFATPAAAARAAAKVAPLADFTRLADPEQRRRMASDTSLREAVTAAFDATRGSTTPPWPDYPSGERTGASYAEGYDAKRRAAQRAG